MNTTKAPKSASQICEAIALDLKARGLTHADVAQLTEKAKHTISAQISGKRRFSKEMAMVFSEKLGYNPLFLLYGEGSLHASEENTDLAPVPFNFDFNIDDMNNAINVLASMSSIATEIIYELGNENAASAWSALREGDYEGYINAMVNLQDELGGRRLMISPVLARVVCQYIKNSKKNGHGWTYIQLEYPSGPA